MWKNIPADMLMHVGQFLHHRDARCMQSTCTDWDQIWTSGGLVSPHPVVQTIEFCDKYYCTNRQYIINDIEPFIGVRKNNLSVHVVLFMMFLTPVRCTWSVSQRLHLKTLSRRCKQLENSLVFWCDCEDTEKNNTPLICLEDHQGVSRRIRTEPIVDNLYVWICLSIILSVPTMMIVTSCTTVLVVVYISMDIYNH